MKSAVRALAAAAALVSAAPAVAAEYQVVTEGDDMVILADLESVVRTRSRVTLWFMMIYATPMDGGVWRVAERHEFDCAKKRDRVLQDATFDKAGRVVGGTEEATGWESRVPGSLGTEMATFACAKDRSAYTAAPRAMTIAEIAETYWTGFAQAGADALPPPLAERLAPVVLQVPPAPVAERFAQGAGESPAQGAGAAANAPAASGSIYVVGEYRDTLLLGEVMAASRGLPRFRFHILHTAAQEDGGWTHAYIVEFDCRAGKARIEQQAAYGRDHRELKRSSEGADWTAPEAGSWAADGQAFGCAADRSKYARLNAGATVIAVADHLRAPEAPAAEAPARGSGAWGRPPAASRR